MPLIPQQNVIVIEQHNGKFEDAVKKLMEILEPYPPCRIVSVAIEAARVLGDVPTLVAVVETV